MQTTPTKLFNSFNSTLQSEGFPSPRTQGTPTKRFNRSNKSSRSKSKEDPVDKSTPQFFVKNVCTQILDKQHKPHTFLGQVNRPRALQGHKQKRQDTPAKKKQSKQVPQSLISNSKFEEGLEKELEWLKIQREVKEVHQKNEYLRNVNQGLEQKLTIISLELAETINKNCFLEEKLKYFEQRQRQLMSKESRSTNNITKLKKMIAQNRQSDCCQAVKQKNKELLSEIQLLKEKLQMLHNTLEQTKVSRTQMFNERESFLDDLVQQLKIELTEKDELMHKMRIQLNIFLVRQAKSNGKTQMKKLEEFDEIKKKYTLVLKKYHEASQELSAYKRKNEQIGNIFSSSRNTKTRKSSTDSLSFSP